MNLIVYILLAIIFWLPIWVTLILYLDITSIKKNEDIKEEKTVSLLLIALRNRLLSKNFSYVLLIIAATMYFLSVVFIARADYSNVYFLYRYLLLSDLLRYIAMIIFSVFAGISTIKLIVPKLNNPKIIYIAMLVLLLVAASLLGFLTSTLRNINDKYPFQIQGTVTSKYDVKYGKYDSKIEFTISLNNSKEYFVMRGDNSKNGYEITREGDYVRLWIDKYSNEVFLIEKIE